MYRQTLILIDLHVGGNEMFSKVVVVTKFVDKNTADRIKFCFGNHYSGESRIVSRSVIQKSRCFTNLHIDNVAS